MKRTAFLAVAFVTLGAALPRAQQAGVSIAFDAGRVTISAADALVADVLEEWARVGGTRITGADKLTALRLTIKLVDVPETEALQAVIGSTAGYIFTRRPQAAAGLSSLQNLIVAQAPPGDAAAAKPAIRRLADEVDMSIPESRFEYPSPMSTEEMDALLREKAEQRANAGPPVSPEEALIIPEVRFSYPMPPLPETVDDPESESKPDPKTKKPPPGR